MIHLIVLVTALSACLADEAAQPIAAPHTLHHEYQRAEDHRLLQNLELLRNNLKVPNNPHRELADPYNRDRYGNHRDNHRDEGHEAWHDDRVKHETKWWTDKDRLHHPDDDGEDDGRPVILRSIKSHQDHHTPNIARQNEIIKHVYSPDYAQPIWIMDYRYLKSGGRDYTRGPGGQILILPKGVRTDEHKEFANYDELIEDLRIKNLKERAKPRYFMPLGQEVEDHQEGWKDDKKWYN